MLHRIIGASGSGKTEYMLSALGDALKHKKSCYLIVPEQSSVDNERLLLERFGDSCNMYCEVLNFERLPNRVAREYGGLAYESIDKGGACALLSVISEDNKQKLCEYSSAVRDAGFAEMLFSLISKLKTSLITPEAVLAASETFSGDTRLCGKLKDIALIYSEYEKCFGEALYDPRDALTRLAEELPEKPFFDGSCVFIDGYYTFTEQEYAVIKCLIASASEIYVSFTVSDERTFFRENENAAKRVLSLAGNVSDDHYTGDYRRSGDIFLRKLEKDIFRTNPEKLSGKCESIKIITAKNRFDEVEAAASEILSFVRAGNRFRDIAVVCGNTDAYSGIVSSVFARAGIKCCISSKEELAAKPLFAFLLASISVVTENFSLLSMKRYIKSGFSGLTVAESDAVLSYAYSWKLRGKAWYADEDWTYDPEGYREGDLTARGAKILKTVNAARRKLVAPLSALREDFADKDLTVGSGIKALFNHMEAMSARLTLHKNSERLLRAGDYEKAERDIQLWNLLVNIFDQLYKYCGDRKTDPKRLSELLRLMCDCYSLGAIPASADSVTFGDAALLRAGGKKMVVALGTSDGEFPKNAAQSLFFDASEAVALEECGIHIADTFEKQINTNRFLVYAALTAPSEKLVICRPVSELSGETLGRSSVISSLKSFLAPDETDFSYEDLLYSRSAVAAFYSSLKEGDLKNKIKKVLLEKHEPFFENGINTFDKESNIKTRIEALNMSPSRIENYLLCPFSYFGNYILGLKEKKENDWSAPEMGNYVHKILESFLRDRTSTGAFVIASDCDIDTMIDKFSEDYIKMYIGNEAMKDKRFKHTFDNMKRTVALAAKNISEEFSASRFIPAGYEYKIGLTESPDIPAVEYDVEGKKLRVRGSIDRVDTCVVNGKTYVRVVDYKTYDKKLSLDLLEYGLDAQMFHYLFAYCRKNHTLPAGVIYHVINMPDIDESEYNTPEKLSAQINKTFSRNGIVLDDMDVIRAMNSSSAFLPVKITSKGELDKRSLSKSASADELLRIRQMLDDNVISVGTNIFGGKMDIAPNDVGGKKDPCKYCKLASFCRGKKHEEICEDTETEEV